MSYLAITDIVNLFTNVFGNPLIITLFIFGMIIFMLVMIRASWEIMVIILLPLVLTVAFISGSSFAFGSLTMAVLFLWFIALIISGLFTFFWLR